jgi:ATP-dependent DNA helicase RecG
MPATALTEPLENIFSKLELMNDGAPNNAAAALFSTKLSGYTQMRLRMARFRGVNKMEFIDNQRVEGNFFQLLDAGMAFFLKHLNMSGKIVGFHREENMEVPAEALREALTNCLCHRQFEKYNLTPSIAIYDDRIEIENPGVLPPQLNTETIKLSHGSYPYNPIMAEVLYRTTFLESWGSGASRIVDACKAQNVPEPTWTINGGFICVTFVRPITDPMKAPMGLQQELSQPQVEPKYEPSTNQVRTK